MLRYRCRAGLCNMIGAFAVAVDGYQIGTRIAQAGKHDAGGNNGSRQRDGFLWMESAAAVGAVGGEIDGLLHCDLALLVASLPLHPECDAEEKDAACKRRRPYSLKGDCPLIGSLLAHQYCLAHAMGAVENMAGLGIEQRRFFPAVHEAIQEFVIRAMAGIETGSYFRGKVAKAILEPLFRRNFARVRHGSSCLRDLY